MVTLYVTSSERAAGKTALCAGMGLSLLNDGKKVGFFKPVIADSDNPPAGDVDSDTVFIKRVFALEEPIEYLCPVISDRGDLADSLKKACARVSKGKDVVVVEGVCGQSSGNGLNKTSFTIAEALGARVIVIENYEQSRKITLMNSYKDFGRDLLGVVLNKVPVNRLEQVYTEVSARLGKAGINTLAVLPEDRTLFALTVAELAQHIQGEILNHAEKSAELVENLMLSAKVVDPGPDYFSRKTNKAVVVGSERPDMQMAALETPTRCLVLSGNTPPTSAVQYQAEVKNVPLISADTDAVSILASIEDALVDAKFGQEKKLPRLAEIMNQHFDFQALYKGLGFAG